MNRSLTLNQEAISLCQGRKDLETVSDWSLTLTKVEGKIHEFWGESRATLLFFSNAIVIDLDILHLIHKYCPSKISPARACFFFQDGTHLLGQNLIVSLNSLKKILGDIRSEEKNLRGSSEGSESFKNISDILSWLTRVKQRWVLNPELAKPEDVQKFSEKMVLVVFEKPTNLPNGIIFFPFLTK